jgi:type III secretion protein T
MDSVALLEAGAEQILFFGASTTRLVIAFLILPLFSNDLIPPLVRNSLFLALSMVVFTVQPDIEISGLQGHEWAAIYAKEAFVGLAIGVFFGVFLWAFESAGIIIDSQIGSSMATIFDPLSGHEVTLFGEFIGRWINYIFLAAGGLLFLTLAVIESFIAWPLLSALPDIEMASLRLFESEFSRFLWLALMIAAPVMVVIFIIDLAMGLVNRFAQRLNVLFLSMSLKALAAILVLLLVMPVMLQLLVRELESHRTSVQVYLEALFGG